MNCLSSVSKYLKCSPAFRIGSESSSKCRCFIVFYNVGLLSGYDTIKPPIFEDSKAFFEKSPLPVYVVSNIDTSDILQAVAYHGLNLAGVFTSEDAKSYKPRKELFELALKSTGLSPDEVIHIGDSVSSDVQGASKVGIRALWLNRFGKSVPEGVENISGLSEAFDRIGQYFY